VCRQGAASAFFAKCRVTVWSRDGQRFGLALYDREQRNVAALPEPKDRRGERALDTGFDSAAPRLTTSQRALASMKRPNGRAADVSDLPV
jgi:hypothetical protein